MAMSARHGLQGGDFFMKVYRKFSPLYNLESGKFDTFVFTGGRGSLKTGSVCRAVLFDLMQH